MTRGEHVERELLLIRLAVAEGSVARLTGVVTQSGARILSAEPANFVVELTSSEAQVNHFIAAASQFGVVADVVRSGALGVSLRNTPAP